MGRRGEKCCLIWRGHFGEDHQAIITVVQKDCWQLILGEPEEMKSNNLVKEKSSIL